MDSKRSWVCETAPLISACLALLSGCTTTAVGAQSPPDGGAAGAAGCTDVSGPVAGTPTATFDNDIEQFTFDIGPSSGTTTSLSDPALGTTPPPSLSYEGAEGNPNPGSLEIFAPFSGANQYLGAFHFFGCGALHDWTGKVLHARIKILDGTFAGAALVYVSTSTTCTSYDFASGAYASLAGTACWQELSLDLGDAPAQTAGYDPTSVVDFGVQFFTGPNGTDAGPVTFLVDSFSIE